MRILLSLLLCVSLSTFSFELHDLVKSGDVAKVRKYVRINFFQRIGSLLIAREQDFYRNRKINSEDFDKRTPLFYAPNLTIAELLVLKCGAKVDHVDINGNTPLFVAAAHNRVDVMRFLIDSGAQLNHRNNLGQTPLFVVALNLSIDGVRLLLERGANVPFTARQSKEIMKLQNQEIIQMLESKNILSKSVEVGFKDIGGYENVKDQLKDYISMMKNFEKYKKFGMKSVPHTILYGPPGTGKTLFAVALAEECEIPFVLVSGSELRGKYLGESAERVRDTFAKIKKMACDNGTPGLLIIDEFDSVGRDRNSFTNSLSSEESATVNQFLTELDGGNNKGSSQDLAGTVFVIAITNNLKMLDPALLRAGRLSRHIFVGLPNKEERQLILETYTRYPFSTDVDFRVIAEETEGLSGAELAQLLEEAALAAFKTTNKDTISMSDILAALDRYKTSRSMNSHKPIVKLPMPQVSQGILARIWKMLQGVD